jgi:hypothetical protein
LRYKLALIKTSTRKTARNWLIAVIDPSHTLLQCVSLMSIVRPARVTRIHFLN